MALRNLLLTASILTLAGCASQPVIDTSASAERSFDGLYPIENTIVDKAWARGDIDLSGYTRLKIETTGIQYRPTRSAAASRLSRIRAGETDFPIDDKQRARLAETLREAFAEELKKLERFTLTDEIGADVLILRGGLLDVVSNVPPEGPQRYDVYLESVGEATLMLEMIDSQTGTVLLRTVDRRAAGRVGQPFESNTVSNWFEVKRLAQSWARLLRDRLDALAESMTLREDAV